jgi:hypothetical protein
MYLNFYYAFCLYAYMYPFQHTEKEVRACIRMHEHMIVHLSVPYCAVMDRLYGVLLYRAVRYYAHIIKETQLA